MALEMHHAHRHMCPAFQQDGEIEKGLGVIVPHWEMLSPPSSYLSLWWEQALSGNLKKKKRKNKNTKWKNSSWFLDRAESRTRNQVFCDVHSPRYCCIKFQNQCAVTFTYFNILARANQPFTCSSPQTGTSCCPHWLTQSLLPQPPELLGVEVHTLTASFSDGHGIGVRFPRGLSLLSNSI